MSAQAAETLVVGLGQTGMSVLRFLARRGEPLAAADSRERPPFLSELRQKYPGLALYLGAFDAEQFRRYRRIVLSPGVPLSTPAVQAALASGSEVIGDIELFARHADAPVVAVTGSNGKSTVVSLLQAMAEAAGVPSRAGGNLGPPALDLLDGEPVRFYLLELSSFQLETTRSLAPAAASVLNVSADHMDRYPDFAAYAAAKWRIYEGAECRVFNRDDPGSRPIGTDEAGWHAFALARPEAADYRVAGVGSGQWLVRGERRLAAVERIRLQGRHNLANALAALALGECMGLPGEAMAEALARFGGLPHRSQFVARVGQVDWYDDSKGTNVGATLAALQGFEQPLVWIAGGESKGADFTPLKAAVADRVRAAVLIGRDAQLLAAALDGVVPVLFATRMIDAVRIAAAKARPGDAVLLSPACASFDMFNGYAHRGEVFARAVRELAA